MAKTDEFDPYRTWLGIPPHEQPPTHYRLLGISECEDDGEVISNAADRQMAHVRTFQSGARSALSQKILNELAAARVCLLDPKQKRAYDAKLKKRRAAAAPPPAPVRVAAVSPVAVSPGDAVDIPRGQPLPESAAADSSPEIPQFTSRASVSSTRRRARRKSSPVPIVLGVIAFAALVGVLIYVVGSGGGRPKPEPGGTSGSTGSAAAAGTAARPATDERPRRDKVERRPDRGRREGGPRDRRPDGQGDVPAGGQPDGNDGGLNFAAAEDLNKMLAQARASLEAGDVAAARRHLDEAAGKAPPGAAPARIATLRTVADHLEKFHQALFAGLRGLPADASLSTDGGLVTVNRVEPGEPPQATFSFAGERRTRPATQLPPQIAVAVAQREGHGDDPRSKLYAAVYVSLRRGDEPIVGPMRQLWQEVRDADLAPEELLVELDAPPSIARPEPQDPPDGAGPPVGPP